MSEKNLTHGESPSASIVLSVIACMVAFSGGTSYFVDVISYNKIDPVTVTFMATYVIIFTSTILITVGFCLYSKNKQRLIAIGAFLTAFSILVQNIAWLIGYGAFNGGLLDFVLYCVRVLALVFIGLYYVSKKPVIAPALKLTVSIAALVGALVIFTEFLIEPEGVGEYVAPWCMHPIFMYTAVIFYTPFRK